MDEAGVVQGPYPATEVHCEEELDAANRKKSFLLRKFAQCIGMRNRSRTKAVPCILHDARSRGSTWDISCRTIPPLETAITAIESMIHALFGLRFVRTYSVRQFGV